MSDQLTKLIDAEARVASARPRICRRALRKLISTFKEILEMRLNFNSYKMQLLRVEKTSTTCVCIDANNNDAAVAGSRSGLTTARIHKLMRNYFTSKDRAENLGGLFQERLGWCRQRRRRH